jgi:hypothetical protein
MAADDRMQQLLFESKIWELAWINYQVETYR